MTRFSVPSNCACDRSECGPAASLLSPIGRWALLGLLMAGPLAVGAVQAWAWAGMSILAVLLLALWAIHQVAAGKLRLVWSGLLAPPILLVGVALVQLLAGLTMDAVATREAVLKLCSCVLVFFLALQHFGGASSRLWRKAALAITIYAFALALFAIVQFFASPGLLYGMIKPRWGGYVFGPYVSHNNYAGLMEMLIPLAVGLALSLPPRHAAKPLVLFTVLLCLLSVLLSGSRGGVIAVVAEFALLGLLVFLARASTERNRALLAGLALVVTAGASFFWLDPGGVWQRWEQLADSPRLSSSDRGRMTGDALRLARDHPASGVGLGAFAAAYPAYQTVVTDNVIDYAHNDYVQFLAEAGIAAAILLPVSLAAFFSAAFRRLRRRLEQPQGWLQLGAAVGGSGILVHSLVDFNLHIPANAAWFAFCAAWAALDLHPQPPY